MTHDRPTSTELNELLELSYRAAYRILGSRADAEDAAQAAALAAVVNWSKVRSYADAFTARAAINHALGVRRFQHRFQRNRGRYASALPPNSTDGAIDRVDLRKALLQLPRRQREAVTLRYLADLPIAEVAAAMGVSAGSVKTHSSRGVAALKTHMSTTDSSAVPGTRADHSAYPGKQSILDQEEQGV